MFFHKKSPQKIEKENVAKKGIKSMDAVVTGVILSGIVASLYGVKKLREKDHSSTDHHASEHLIEPSVETEQRK